MRANPMALCDVSCRRSSLSFFQNSTLSSAGEADRGLDMPLLRNSRGAQARPCTMYYHAQPVPSCRTGLACLVVWPMCTGVGRRRFAALDIAALYHCLASAHCEMRLTPMQQAPRSVCLFCAEDSCKFFLRVFGGSLTQMGPKDDCEFLAKTIAQDSDKEYCDGLESGLR